MDMDFMKVKMSKSEIATSVTRFEKQFGRLYDLRIHYPENILPGKAVYAANHFNHFDPVFILYAIAKFRNVLAHQFAKPGLFRLPIIGQILKKNQAIVTPRPSKGEVFEFDDYERMKEDIRTILEKDEPLSYAYAGTMTSNYAVDEKSLHKEQAIASSGMLSLVRKMRGLKIVPVAVETYQKRSPKLMVDAFLTLSGIRRLLPVRRRHAADLVFGEAVDIDTFMKQRHPETGRGMTRQDLIEYVVEKIYTLRQELQERNKGDAGRSVERYY